MDAFRRNFLRNAFILFRLIIICKLPHAKINMRGGYLSILALL